MAANHSKMTADERRQALLDAALAAASTLGFQQVTSGDVATRAGCSDGLVRQNIPTGALADAIMREAVRTGSLRIIAQGLAVRHPIALDAPLDLRMRAAETLI